MKRLLAAGIAASAILAIACSDNEVTIGPTDEPTAIEATATPEPTERATLKPARTIPPAALEAVDAYFDDLVDWLDEAQRLSDGVVEIAESDDPISASNEAKARALSVDADVWRDEAIAFDAPAGATELQMWIELAGVTMADSLADFWLAIRFVDIDLANSAVDKMGTAMEYIDNAGTIIAEGP